jgi:hypothetical protein
VAKFLPTTKRNPRRLVFGVALVLALILCGWELLKNRPTGSGDPKKDQAEAACKALASACESYTDHPANRQHKPPASLDDLLKPPFGGPSFLQNGEDLTDPWGRPFQMERVTLRDGKVFMMIKTTAPDATPISQFGIGKNASPRME